MNLSLQEVLDIISYFFRYIISYRPTAAATKQYFVLYNNHT